MVGSGTYQFGDLTLEISHRESISFIGAYNGRPIVNRLSLRTSDGRAYDGVTVDVVIRIGDQDFSNTWSREGGQLGPRPVLWTHEDLADLRLDSNLLLQLAERRHAQLRISVRQHECALGEITLPIDLLAPDSWVAGNPLDRYVIDLAAFVQPQEAALRPLLNAAASRLRTATGSDALSGYQGGTERADAMVRSIYEAVQEHRVTYSDPPTSWGLSDSPNQQGQRVRLPAQVLSDQVGTCLDTTILMASLMAAVGLLPVLLITQDHALVAYWRDERSPARRLIGALGDFRNLVDAGALVPVETTALTGSTSFAEALDEGRLRFNRYADQEDPSLITECVAVDVHAAHTHGTIPLPTRTVRADGTVELTEYRPAELSIALLDRAIAAEANTTIGLQANDAPPRVKRWMDSLLDLSLRNPLLNYRFPQSSSVSLMLPEGTLGRLEDLLQVGVSVPLLPNVIQGGGGLTPRRTLHPRLGDELTRILISERSVAVAIQPDSFAARLRRMHSSARTMLEESGSNQLFLALGMVVWRPEGRAELSSAPLILVPVNLKPRNRYREFSLEIDTGSQITPNFSLAERLKNDAKLRLDRLVEPAMDDAGVDIDGLISYVRDEFARAGLTDYRVDESATLGFFDFSTYRLWRDVKENWPRFVENSPLVKHLVETPTMPFQETAAGESSVDLDDFAAALPVPADASQARAVLDAMDGKSFVLQGPPGTGKSQTITNLLARALHSGKRVLFVAEKPDALAVVRDRLEKVGLGAFGLNLHDKGMRAAEVRRQLSEALNATGLADRVGFEAAERNIGRAIPPLRRYVERLHTDGRLGESAYSARNKLLALGDGPALPVPPSFVSSVDRATLEAVRSALSEMLETGTSSGDASSNPWSFARVMPEHLTPQRLAHLSTHTRAASEHYRYLKKDPVAEALLREASGIDELRMLSPLLSADIDLALVDASASPSAAQARQYIRQTLDGFDVARLFPGASPASLSAPVPELSTAVNAALTSSFVGRKKRVLAVCERVRTYLAPGADVNHDNVRSVVDALGTLQRSASEYSAYLRQVPGVALDPGFNPIEPSHRSGVMGQLDRIERAVDIAFDDGTPERRRMRSVIASGRTETVRSLGALGVSLGEIWTQTGASSASAGLWTGQSGATAMLDRDIDRWSNDLAERSGIQLRRWARLREELAVLEGAGLQEASAQIGAGVISFGDADEAFERGLLKALQQRQFEDENLDSFDGEQHDAAARTFTAAASDLRSLSPGVLAEDMISARGFDAGVTVGAVGELRRELAKQRQTKPIRRLLRDHWHVVSRVTPLVLAIPDALVRFVDGDLEAFDLVVFDEASQIRTAHAIGVLGRGHAAVVVGDDKQMPPTSVAHVRAETDEAFEDDAEDDYEQESILSEAIQARTPQISLTWHYRSEDESLIAFSNKRYYDSTLNTLPSPRQRDQGKGLSFIRVDGRFQRQRGRRSDDAADALAGGTADPGTNPGEAAEIVREIVRRLHDPLESRHSIGVVTFNRPQQRLVQSLLVATEDPAVLTAIDREQTAEPVTVWNLETVQGSERDVMLFSIAFSKDEHGRLSRNFGPLNNLGGHRRLNVAVTRARRQVIVFCSFDPEDLRSDGLAEGLRHLERYLLIARDGVESDGALSTHRPSAPDRHRDEIVAALRSRGLQVESDVGLSDFKVDIAVAPAGVEGWILGLLTDGPAWSRRKTVGDRDSLPLTLLGERMGWPAVARVWLPDWLRDPSAVVDRIELLVADAQARPGRDGEVSPMNPGAATTTPPATQESHFSNVPAAERDLASPAGTAEPFAHVPSWREWLPSGFGPAFVLEQLWDERTQRYLQAAVAEIIRIEGPVKAERAARLLGKMHGLERVRDARVQAIVGAVSSGFATSPDGFWFDPGAAPEAHQGWSRSNESNRSVDEISLIEISNAMRDVARVGLGASREELVAATAGALGYRRVTAKIRERLLAGVDEGIRRGVLREQNGYLVAV